MSTSCMYMLLLDVRCIDIFFFFSSRRRHTRFDCDWSSDVCSSDLVNVPHHGAAFHFIGPDCSPVHAWRGRPEFGERSEEHTSELQSQSNLVCRLLLEKKKKDRTCQRYSSTRNTHT